MDEIMKVALGQGLGYAMFFFLFIYVLKKQEKRDLKSEEREAKYQQIIGELTNTVNVKLDKLISLVQNIPLKKT